LSLASSGVPWDVVHNLSQVELIKYFKAYKLIEGRRTYALFEAIAANFCDEQTRDQLLNKWLGFSETKTSSKTVTLSEFMEFAKNGNRFFSE
jgi:hypothetical protein